MRGQEEVALGQDLVPERLDFGHLGEEAMTPQIEAPPVTNDGAADAAHHVVALEDHGALAPLGQ